MTIRAKLARARQQKEDKVPLDLAFAAVTGLVTNVASDAVPVALASQGDDTMLRLSPLRERARSTEQTGLPIIFPHGQFLVAGASFCLPGLTEYLVPHRASVETQVVRP